MKKLIYKKWWFWVLAVLALFILITIILPDSEMPDKTTTIATQGTTLGMENNISTTVVISTTDTETTARIANTSTADAKTSETQTSAIPTVAISILPTETTTKKAIITTQEATEKDVSWGVYRTPYGERYHYISTCGGKNSFEITLNQAKASGLTPCKKCADG